MNKMSDTEFVYHLIFLLFSFCVIYPPTEFVALGLTINNIFASFLGSEDIEFVQYHLRRTSLTVVAHTLLPIIYIECYYLKFDHILEYNTEFYLKFLLWNSFVIFSFVLPIISIGIIWYWLKNDWECHPIVQNIKKYCNSGENWDRLAADINAEFRRNDKLIMKTSAIHAVVATQNWIMKASNYSLNIAYQSDTALIAIQSDSHGINENSADAIQFVNIRVKATRPGVAEFLIRINALDFKSLQDRMLRPITILEGVNFNKSVIERFIEVFKDQVNLNPRYKTAEITDSCFACMQAQPNIKLQKQCLDIDENGHPLSENNRCGNCYCRPMWCLDCMAKWFASRQNQYEKEVWLQQKCTCPMCRAPFCILDVCYVELDES